MFRKTILTTFVGRHHRNMNVSISYLSFKRLARWMSTISSSLTVPSPRDSHPEHLQLDDAPQPHALKPAQEDLSFVTTPLPDTFNFAAYVNRSESLQNLVKLGVNLSKIEKKPYVTETMMKLDFERDMKKHLFFLKDYVSDDELGHFITKNPLIFKIDLQDLETRINYLMWKQFNTDNIKRIVTKNPFWLMFSTVRIDKRLGFFQQKFHLNGKQVRELTVRQPKLITYSMQDINTNCFAIKEEMGFNDNEIRRLVLNKPRIWMMNQLSLIRRFNYVHNVMKISHESIVRSPEVLLSRQFRIQQRHSFLEKLGRAQYDPKKEKYVPLVSLAEGTDADFCKNVAKCTVDDLNMFLKTL